MRQKLLKATLIKREGENFFAIFLPLSFADSYFESFWAILRFFCLFS